MDVAEFRRLYSHDRRFEASVDALAKTIQDDEVDANALASSLLAGMPSKEEQANFLEPYFDAIRNMECSTTVLLRLVKLLDAIGAQTEGGCPYALGMYIEEYGTPLAPDHPNLTPEDAEQWEDHIAPFTRAQTWAATYFVHGRIANIANELLWNAEYLFINALETSLKDDVQIRASRFHLAATVEWLEICGEQIYQLCSGKRSSLRPKWSQGSGIVDFGGEWLWTGGHVFDMQRWEFWKARYQVLSGLSGLSEHYRSLARKALATMSAQGVTVITTS